MTVHLDWPPDVVARLQQEAEQQGLRLDDYLLQTLLVGLSSEHVSGTSAPASEGLRRKLREDAGRRIRELQTQNVLGPDLTVRDLIEDRRRF
jgi:hypothetical protein